MKSTLGSRFDAAKGRPSGFDYLRIGLSISIVVWHTIPVCYGPESEMLFRAGPLRPIIAFLVPSFFALSGFLVAGSLLRNDLLTFLTLRIVRIFPALVCETLISAFLIGGLLTDWSALSYFTDTEFWSYMKNVVGNIHYSLPGVFEANPSHVVNLQLWTIPYELRCYLVLSAMLVLGLVRRPVLFAGLLAASFLIFNIHKLFSISGLSYNPGLALLTDGPPGLICVMAFLVGVSIYFFRDRLPFGKGAWASALILSILCLNFTASSSYIAAVPVAYLTVMLGVTNPRRNILIARADYSYGIYLYGFTVQQAVYQLGGRAWYVNLPVSLALIVAVAAISWTCVEEPIARRKRTIVTAVIKLRGMLATAGSRVLEKMS